MVVGWGEGVRGARYPGGGTALLHRTTIVIGTQLIYNSL